MSPPTGSSFEDWDLWICPKRCRRGFDVWWVQVRKSTYQNLITYLRFEWFWRWDTYPNKSIPQSIESKACQATGDSCQRCRGMSSYKTIYACKKKKKKKKKRSLLYQALIKLRLLRAASKSGRVRYSVPEERGYVDVESSGNFLPDQVSVWTCRYI